MAIKKTKLDVAVKRASARSFGITSVLCQRLRPRPCAKTFTNLRLSLPSPQIAEKLYDLAEVRVLVLYPMLPQNLHKLPLIPIFENLPEIAQQDAPSRPLAKKLLN